ncbi:hypothetical protein PsorP6_012550 [Peronosclerospora sorghi]|uniref:Uncharacterized protein n=1 Tax=Peronosclerospora sorghi TaxID=230839 RepID=A0ACC0WFE6_9STRA|nr:hypothetical protein PsorP6_012550 [Peronosclerospora sorghi]
MGQGSCPGWALSFDCTGTTNHNVSLGALLRLTRAIHEHQRLYSDMLRYLKAQFGFCKSNDTRRLIVNLTRHNCTQLLEWPRKYFSNITYDVLELVQKLPVVCRRGSLLPSTKGEVVDALMEFLMELVDRYVVEWLIRIFEIRSGVPKAPELPTNERGPPVVIGLCLAHLVYPTVGAWVALQVTGA